MNIAIHMTVFVHAWQFAAHLNHLALPVLNVAVVIADKLRLKERESPANCRFCRGKLKHTFVDLGMSPPCEAILAQSQLNQMEAFYPLHVFVCDSCFLVQLQEYVAPENIFTEYAYFSSYSDSWLAHANSYSKRMIERFGFDRQSQVIELGSNDGYLLQYFVDAGIPVLGIEPAANVAKVAVNKGIPTVVKFFGAELAEQLRSEGMAADLLLGNNVLAQVPNLRSFVKGMKILLKPQGILTLEFPHLMRLMEENQFDTIYHEHFSYFSIHHRYEDPCRIWPDSIRRRRVAHARRFAASLCASSRKCRSTCNKPRSGAFDARDSSGSHMSRDLLFIRRKGERDKAQDPAFPDSSKKGREDRCRIRRAREREHPSQLLRHQDRFSRLHGGSQSLQTWQVSGGHSYSSLRTGEDP